MILDKVDFYGEEITNFYVKQAGKSIDLKKEYALLINWLDAIDDALQKGQEPEWYIAELHEMKQECMVFIEINAESSC